MNEHDPTNAFESGFLDVLEKKGFPPVTLTESHQEVPHGSFTLFALLELDDAER